MEVTYNNEQEASFNEMVHVLKELSEREQESVRDILRGFQLARRYAVDSALSENNEQGTA